MLISFLGKIQKIYHSTNVHIYKKVHAHTQNTFVNVNEQKAESVELTYLFFENNSCSI